MRGGQSAEGERLWARCWPPLRAALAGKGAEKGETGDAVRCPCCLPPSRAPPVPPLLPAPRERSLAARVGTAAAVLQQKLRGKLSPLARAPPLRGGAGRGGAERPSRLGICSSGAPPAWPRSGAAPPPSRGARRRLRGGHAGSAPALRRLYPRGGRCGARGQRRSSVDPPAPSRSVSPAAVCAPALCNLPSGPPLFPPLMFPISPPRVSPPSTHPQFSLPVKQDTSHSSGSFLFIPSCTLQVGLQ